MEPLAAVALASVCIAAGSLIVAILAYRRGGSQLTTAERTAVLERFHKIETELATVDNRIAIKCHERVRRAGEYWEFHNRVEGFMERVNRSGVLGK